MRLLLAAPLLFAFTLCGSCGYHVSGRGDVLPKSIGTIAVSSFGNATIRYKLTDRLPAAITREFIARTRYRVVADPKEADAVLTGTILNFFTSPTVFDPATGRASVVQVSVYIRMELRDRVSGAVLYSQPGREFRQRYEISTDQGTYFEESDVALERVSRDVARTLVSAVLEAF